MEDLFAQKDVGLYFPLFRETLLGLQLYLCVKMEEAELRSWIEKFQARLQSCGQVSPQQLHTVLESLVMKKQSLCEMLQYWNSRSASTYW